MSDFPERISISPVYRKKRDDDFYLVDRKAFPGKGTEYIRTDLAQAMIVKAREDALREAAELLLGTIRREYGDHRDFREAILAAIEAPQP